LHPDDIEHQKEEKATKLLQKRSITDCIDSNRNQSRRYR
jgi:hypothetical protein